MNKLKQEKAPCCHHDDEDEEEASPEETVYNETKTKES